MAEVLLKIDTIQTDLRSGEGDPEPVHTEGRGDFRKEKDGIRIVYEEPEENGLGKSVTTLLLTEEGSMRIERAGEVSCRFLIEPGVLHDCVYEASAMPFSLAVKGEAVCFGELPGKPFMLNASYLLCVNGEPCFRNSVSLTASRTRRCAGDPKKEKGKEKETQDENTDPSR